VKLFSPKGSEGRQKVGSPKNKDLIQSGDGRNESKNPKSSEASPNQANQSSNAMTAKQQVIKRNVVNFYNNENPKKFI